jgi:hypothetical protein
MLYSVIRTTKVKFLLTRFTDISQGVLGITCNLCTRVDMRLLLQLVVIERLVAHIPKSNLPNNKVVCYISIYVRLLNALYTSHIYCMNQMYTTTGAS